ncbi:MAG: tRNA adenosine(34) deaminase TadA [Coriobacteriia bacterium]|nr:tRNA adenosine(34) deaminase TadA [Coriobacteriia bacterium]
MDDEYYMMKALNLALVAAARDEVPVGAVVVKDNNIIAKAYNRREETKDPAAHAEFLAIQEACEKLNTWRLNDCTVYVTLEPCIMCAGLMQQVRIERCVFGAYDKKCGALSSLYKINEDKRLNHTFEAKGGVFGAECGRLLTTFFKTKR